MIDIRTSGLPLPHTKFAPAHQVLWVLENGPIPEGRMIYRSCGDGRCMNPDHLVCGTRSDEQYSEACRRRSNRAERGRTFTRDLARGIRQWAEENRDSRGRLRYGWLTEVSEILGVSRNTLIDVVRGRTWRDDV